MQHCASAAAVPGLWLRRALWLLLLTLRLRNDGAQAQIYHLQETAIPPNRSLHMLYTYYVYSHEDAPEKKFGPPFVKYHELSAHSVEGRTDLDLQDYNGLQLSLMKYDDFFNIIDPDHFCCSGDDVSSGQCAVQDKLRVKLKPGMRLRDGGVYSDMIRFAGTADRANHKDKQLRVRETGVYILMISNCGDHDSATVSGSVIVRNPFGFLPGNEYYKMPFYGWLSLVYMALGVIWMVLSIRWFKELFNLQGCIAGVILLGLVESFLWYFFFTKWNEDGIRTNVLFVLAILSSVAKTTFSYLLVLVASLGWGVTRPYLDKDITIRIQAICLLYMCLGVIREVVLSFRHSHSLPLAFVLLCLLPVSLLNGVIFYWVFTALSSLISTLKDRRQMEKLQLFQRLWGILIFSLSIATITLLYQILDVSRSIADRWMHQWLFTDGVSHVLYLLVLASMMYLWAPHKNSQRYAYSAIEAQDSKPDIGSGRAQSGSDVWDADSDASPNSLTSPSKFSSADTIGAASSTAVLKDTLRELDRIGAVDEEEPTEKTE